MRYGPIGRLFVALLLAGNARPQGVITIFAGGNWVFTGNGRPAVNAPLGNVYGATLDPAGNLVIADHSNCLVERINPDGTLSVIAGNGLYFLNTHTGDGGSALNANLNNPDAVAYDSQGNLYIAENDRISRVSPQGIINTYAAGVSPFGGGGGLVVDAAGVVYFTEYLKNRVRKVTPDGMIATVAGTSTAGFSGDGGMATAAQLNGPLGLALDRTGNLYIADNGNRALRKVTPAGTISSVSIVGGIDASGLAFDNNGVFYLAGDGFVAKLPPGASSLSVTAGQPGAIGFSGDGGPAPAARFSSVLSIVADNLGNLFVGDQANDRVRRISASGTVTTAAGNGQFYYTGEGLRARGKSMRWCRSV